MAEMKLKECDLFELAHVLRVRTLLPSATAASDKDNDVKNYPHIALWDFYDDSERSLLILVCRNGQDTKETILVRHHQLYQEAIFKEIPWFQGPLYSMQSIKLDPSGTWLLCSCKDQHVYLVPVMAFILGADEVDCPPYWKNNDVTKFPPHDRQGVVTSIAWWEQSLVNTHICIFGTELGEIVFVDLHKLGQIVFQASVTNSVKCLNIVQDKVHGTSYLMVQTKLGHTWKLLLESYSMKHVSPDAVSLSEIQLGFEVLNQQSAPLHSLMVQHNTSPLQLEQISQVENEAVQLSIQYARNQFFLCSLNFDTHIFQVYDVDSENVPMFIYDLGEVTKKVLLTDRMLFTVTGKQYKAHINIHSSQMAETCLSLSAPKKKKEKPASGIQTFLLPEGEHILAIFRLTMYTILEKLRKSGNGHPVDGCLVITTVAVYEVRPRVSPEELFIDLAVNNIDTTAADRLAIITGLDVNTLYEEAGDLAMAAGQLRHALDLYQASKCSYSVRVNKFSKHASVADVIVYIQEILHEPLGDVSSSERKQLANMVIKCFVYEVFNNNAQTEQKLKEDFCQFINDNFDYDEYAAVEMLAKLGLEQYLFQVAKARGLIEEALDALATQGHYHLSETTRTFLISKGFADVVCASNNGAFLRCLAPGNALQLILAKPECVITHLQYVESLLPVLHENHLLRLAKLLDPSRPAAKTLFMKLTAPRRHRSASGSSQASLDNYLSLKDDLNGPAIPDLLQLFLATLLVLNSARSFDTFPDLALISEHCEEKTKSKELEESILGGNILPEYVTLSCGQQHCALVTSHGDLYTWGNSGSGRLGHGDLVEEEGQLTPFRVQLLHVQKIKVQSVSCGREHTLALTKQGVYSWGSSQYGQLGLGDHLKQTRPVFVTELADKECITLTCGYYHSLALSADRGVWAWGWGVHGQLGFGNVEDYLLPARITSLDRCSVIRLAAGYSHTAVLASQGKVFTFGGGVFGQLGLGMIKKQSTPKLVEGIAHEKVQLLCCGSFETMMVTLNQKFYKCGRNAQLIRHAKDYFQKTDHRSSSKKELTHYFVPVEINLKIPSPIVLMRCGTSHVIFLTEHGHVYTMGQNDHGQLGTGNLVEKATPVLVQDLIPYEIISVASGAAHCVVVTAEGHTLVWGRGDSGQLGIESSKPKNVSTPKMLRNIPVHKLSDNLTISSESLHDFALEFERELSDLSAVGDCPYSREALATSLYQLWGFYHETAILRRCYDVDDPFSASVVFKKQEKWSVALSYRLKALTKIFKNENRTESLKQLGILAKTIIQDVIRTLSRHCQDDFYPIHQLVMVVNEVLRFWIGSCLDDNELEMFLKDHLDVVAFPLSVLILRKSLTNNQSLDYDNGEHLLSALRMFSPGFLYQVTEASVGQLRNDLSKRRLFQDDLDTLLSHRTCSQDEPASSHEKVWQEILDHFQRHLDKSISISLSTATASTLAAATLTLAENDLRKSKSSMNVVAFTCEHSFPLVHFQDMILPEFQQRLAEFSLTQFTERFMTIYSTAGDQIFPSSCPVCVYNFLRSEQDTTGGKALQVWQI